MPQIIQSNNRNSFTPKHKKYKRLRSDIWGQLAYVNKDNDITNRMKNFGEKDLQNKIRHCSKKAKRRILASFGRKVFYKPFEYSVTIKAEGKRKKPLTFRGATSFIRKKISAFYFLRLRRKSLRKLFKRRTTARLYNIPLTTSTSRFLQRPRTSVGSTLESRFDVCLYRLNFISSIYEGRRFIKTKKAFVLGPCNRNRSYRKFFIYSILKKHYHKVPLFYFVTLRYDLCLFRKIVLKNLIHALKLLSYPPDYFMVNYKSMIGLRLHNPSASRVRYPFSGTLAFFIGAALYF